MLIMYSYCFKQPHLIKWGRELINWSTYDLHRQLGYQRRFNISPSPVLMRSWQLLSHVHQHLSYHFHTTYDLLLRIRDLGSSVKKPYRIFNTHWILLKPYHGHEINQSIHIRTNTRREGAGMANKTTYRTTSTRQGNLKCKLPPNFMSMEWAKLTCSSRNIPRNPDPSSKH